MLRTPFIETLSDLFIRSAAWRGRDELFVDDEDRITGEQALDQALRLVRGFADHGAAPGQVIAYLCRSSARHAVTWFAAPLSGRIACSLHVRETPERLGQALGWLDARVLVHDDELETTMRSQRSRRSGPRGQAHQYLGARERRRPPTTAASSPAANRSTLRRIGRDPPTSPPSCSPQAPPESPRASCIPRRRCSRRPRAARW